MAVRKKIKPSQEDFYEPFAFSTSSLDNWVGFRATERCLPARQTSIHGNSFRGNNERFFAIEEKKRGESKKSKSSPSLFFSGNKSSDNKRDKCNNLDYTYHGLKQRGSRSHSSVNTQSEQSSLYSYCGSSSKQSGSVTGSSKSPHSKYIGMKYERWRMDRKEQLTLENASSTGLMLAGKSMTLQARKTKAPLKQSILNRERSRMSQMKMPLKDRSTQSSCQRSKAKKENITKEDPLMNELRKEEDVPSAIEERLIKEQKKVDSGNENIHTLEKICVRRNQQITIQLPTPTEDDVMGFPVINPDSQDPIEDQKKKSTKVHSESTSNHHDDSTYQTDTQTEKRTYIINPHSPYRIGSAKKEMLTVVFPDDIDKLTAPAPTHSNPYSPGWISPVSFSGLDLSLAYWTPEQSPLASPTPHVGHAREAKGRFFQYNN
eukprot:gene19942-21895_t